MAAPHAESVLQVSENYTESFTLATTTSPLHEQQPPDLTTDNASSITCDNDQIPSETSEMLTSDDGKLTIDCDGDQKSESLSVDGKCNDHQMGGGNIKETTQLTADGEAVVMECLKAVQNNTADDAIQDDERNTILNKCPYKNVVVNLAASDDDDINDDDLMSFVNQTIEKALRICADDGLSRLLLEGVTKKDYDVAICLKDQLSPAVIDDDSIEKASANSPPSQTVTIGLKTVADALPAQEPTQETKVNSDSSDICVTDFEREVRSYPKIYPELPDTDNEQLGQKSKEESSSSLAFTVAVEQKAERSDDEDTKDVGGETKTESVVINDDGTSASVDEESAGVVADVSYDVDPVELLQPTEDATGAEPHHTAVDIKLKPSEQPSSTTPSPAGDIDQPIVIIGDICNNAIITPTATIPDVIPDDSRTPNTNEQEERYVPAAPEPKTQLPSMAAAERSDTEAAAESGLALVNDRLRIRIADLQTQIKQLCCELAFVGDRNWRLEAYTDCLIHTLEKMGVTDVEDLDHTTVSQSNAERDCFI